ncbi:MAG: menaquinone biosynthesis protein [Acidobacteria bacterium]|nr:menaquinone biosynthesis protein [Acidobacteriota bacterium]
MTVAPSSRSQARSEARSQDEAVAPKPRVCAVSYLNTSPLVWGALNGPQKGKLDLSFAVPSICADRVVSGDADVGLVPIIEVDRNGLNLVSDVCIACRGDVRSIYLISAKDWADVSTLAVDTGSRTSVQLARIILEQRYGVRPKLEVMEPDLPRMLECADAALLIGDAALSIDPSEVDRPLLDLGREWIEWTGLPMVFAVWAGREAGRWPELAGLLEDSRQYGLGELDAIIKIEAERRGFSEELVQQYLTRNVWFHLGKEERAGMNLYLDFARRLA